MRSPLAIVLLMILPSSLLAEELATFAGGCFWCMQAEFADRPGIRQSTVGYFAIPDGATASDSSARSVTGAKLAEQREVVQLQFDSTQITYDQLLDLFWRNIDPTQEDGQFADRGATYQTAIYYHSDAQQKAALASKQKLEDSKKFAKPIVTAILPASDFTPAPEMHQRYSEKFPERFKTYKELSGRAPFLRRTWGPPSQEK